MNLNRKTALETLLNIEKKGAYSNLALNENIRKYEPENEAFVRELVYGVLKNKYLLDYYLKSYVNKG
ncbi:MAG: 16S rRNA (cytosine(967)-C(5))-methyltransferase, partial [Firmicutes bacterium]|nr:16S rRNA (cytosine(967)-C(5))-methyltransferase [Bacillota bacterium]